MNYSDNLPNPRYLTFYYFLKQSLVHAQFAVKGTLSIH